MQNQRRSNDKVINQVLTFFSTASSTGKTTLAINCAADLAERGYRVCLADCDVQFGDVANCLDLEPDTSLFQIYENDLSNSMISMLNAIDFTDNGINKTPILKKCRALDLNPIYLGVNKKSNRNL